MNLTATHWLLLEQAREEPLEHDEDPEAIDALVVAGLLRPDDDNLFGRTVYVPSDAGLETLARRSA